MTTTDVLKLIKRIITLPPKLMKTAGNFLVEPVTDIINSCFSTNTFPDLAKELHSHQLTRLLLIDTNTYRNYRPVSVLSIFSKIRESLTFDQLTKHAHEFLQIFVGAY